jgi:DNA modification methylase
VAFCFGASFPTWNTDRTKSQLGRDKNNIATFKKIEDDMIYLRDAYCSSSYDDIASSSIDVIITSPPYNRGPWGTGRRLYSASSDSCTPDEYTEKTVKMFSYWSRVLAPGGVILFNFLHSQRTTSNPAYNKAKFSAQNTLSMLSRITTETELNLQEIIYWDKKTNTPSHFSPIQLSHRVEPFYLFAKQVTYHTNKQATSSSKERNRTYYSKCPVSANLIVGSPSVKGYPSFSVEVVRNLLETYCPEGGSVLDPFVGSGTVTKVGIGLGLNVVGFDIDPKLVSEKK